MKTPCGALLLGALVLAARAAHDAETTPRPATVRPIIDTPLRDPAIGRGPDGIYYLTGTAAALPSGVMRSASSTTSADSPGSTPLSVCTHFGNSPRDDR